MGLDLEREQPAYLTTGAVARYCGVSKVTVLRWITKGTLTAFRIPGGHNRVHRDDFNVFAAKHNIPIRENTSKDRGTGEVTQS